MNRIRQEILAGKIEPSSYDCEPPDNVLEELGKPKRPRILGPPLPVKTPHPRWPFYVVVAISLLTLAVAICTSWRQQERERASTGAISKPLTPQSASPPVTLSPEHANRWRANLANNSSAPRAVLVHSVPRATLVKLPPPMALPASDLAPLVVGRQYLGTMPYGLEVLTMFRGALRSQDDLPTHFNHIGDMYIVGNVPFVWLFAPGATHADWIDP